MLRRRVLVTGAGGGVGQGIVKAIRRIKDLPLTVIAADMSPYAAGLYAGDEALLVPAAKHPGYVTEMIAICRRHRVDVYIPGTDVELQVCSAAAERFKSEAGTELLVSSLEFVAMADDKYETSKTLERLGLPYPLSWLPGEVDPDALRYPVIVKPRQGCRSIGVDLVESAAALRTNLRDRNDDPLVQEYVSTEDEEFTCTIAVVGDAASPVLPLRRVLRGGDTYQAEPVRDRRIEEVVRRFALTMGVHGSCNFQLRLDRGTPKIFEVNARFSGTTPLCAQLGFNPVEFCLKALWGHPYDPEIRWDAVIFRHWAEIVVPKREVERLARDGYSTPAGSSTTALEGS